MKSEQYAAYANAVGRQRFAFCFGAFVFAAVACTLSSCTCDLSRTKKAPERIARGTKTSVHVPACAKWTPTGVLVRKGDIYAFKSLPPDRWIDLFVRTSARGYASLTSIQARFESNRRVPSAPWFALCASIGRRGQAFQIQLDDRQPIRDDGELGLFANDAEKAYWNNLGSVNIQIERLR